MKNRERFFCLLTLTLVILGLLAGCGSSGEKLSDPAAIEAYGVMIWDNKLIDVCFTHDQEKIYIYYDDGKYALFETADLPVERFRDGDNDWRISSVETKDVTDNGYSDLRVYISHSDTSESSIFWAWSADKACYVNQPTNSFFYQSKEVDDFSVYEGLWYSDEDNLYNNKYIEFDSEGNWKLYSGDDVIDEGYLDVLEGDGIYIYSNKGGALTDGRVEIEGDRLLIDTAGYFIHAEG